MQTILITGAASGIGAATARLFHARGWAVGLLDRDGEALQRLADELAGAWFAAVDVCDEPAVQQALADFCGAHGGQLHVLFNGAGILRCGPFEQLSLAVPVFVQLYQDHLALEESLIYPEARSRIAEWDLNGMGREMAQRRRARV